MYTYLYIPIGLYTVMFLLGYFRKKRKLKQFLFNKEHGSTLGNFSYEPIAVLISWVIFVSFLLLVFEMNLNIFVEILDGKYNLWNITYIDEDLVVSHLPHYFVLSWALLVLSFAHLFFSGEIRKFFIDHYEYDIRRKIEDEARLRREAANKYDDSETPEDLEELGDTEEFIEDSEHETPRELFLKYNKDIADEKI